MERYLPGLLERLERYVRLESPSTDKSAVDRLAAAVAEEAEALDGQPEFHRQNEAGDHLVVRWSHPGQRSALLLTHLDTVHPVGTLQKMGLVRDGRRMIGPGVFDMKASVAMALTALQALWELKGGPGRSVTLLCTSDEEVGSGSSRALIEDLARGHEVVFCLEPALSDGALKTKRKGIGIFEIEVLGRPAHAGVSPEKGVNAIVEMGRQIGRVEQLQDQELGISVNVGTIRGGTRSNVVPERCTVKVDVRIPTPEHADKLAHAIQGLAPTVEGAEIRVRGGWNRPPMPRTPAIGEAFQQARAIASELGFELGEGSTGGGSDANFVAPLGIPLLDGLGAIGGGAHSQEEFVWIDSLPRRTALLAGLIRAYR